MLSLTCDHRGRARRPSPFDGIDLSRLPIVGPDTIAMYMPRPLRDTIEEAREIYERRLRREFSR